MRGPGDRPVQTRGNTVSEATATTEPVVVEAMRMSNSLCEAMGEPPLDMPGIRIRKKKKGDRLPEATNFSESSGNATVPN